MCCSVRTPRSQSRRKRLDRSERALAVVAHRGFNISLVTSGALLLGVLALGWEARWLDWAEVVLGLAMAIEGALLATNWRGGPRPIPPRRLQDPARAARRKRLCRTAAA